MSIDLNLQQKHLTEQQQIQRLMMLPQMQQAIHLLQLPALELQPLIEAHLALNPVIDLNQEEDSDDQLESLEEENNEEEEKDNSEEKEILFDEKDFEILNRLDQDFKDTFSDEESYIKRRTNDEDRYQSYLEQSIPTKETLAEHLKAQAVEIFDNPLDIEITETIIGYLDQNGFLSSSPLEIASLHNYNEEKVKTILSKLQTFDPYGIGASNLQESLLIQLKCREKQNTLAAKLIENHYFDLLNNKIPNIQKQLHCSREEIENAINKDIASLTLHPGTMYSQTISQTIIPDITIKEDGDKLTIQINDDFLPPLRINKKYLQMMKEKDLAPETKHFIDHHISSAKWLVKNILQRNDTLFRIAEYIIKHQQNFLTQPDGQLSPMTMKMVAEAIDLHESTIARAVANKHVDCLRGIIPLRNFFSNSYKTQEGQVISAKTVLNRVRDIIMNEDHSKPISDADISDILKKQGVNCARRTVAKYRTELKLGNTQQRRKY